MQKKICIVSRFQHFNNKISRLCKAIKNETNSLFICWDITRKRGHVRWNNNMFWYFRVVGVLYNCTPFERQRKSSRCNQVSQFLLSVLFLLPRLRASTKYIDHNTDWWRQTLRHWPPGRGGALHCLAATINIKQSEGRGSWELAVNFDISLRV